MRSFLPPHDSIGNDPTPHDTHVFVPVSTSWVKVCSVCVCVCVVRAREIMDLIDSVEFSHKRIQNIQELNFAMPAQ